MNTGPDEKNLQKILDLLEEKKGFQADRYKKNYIKRRIAVRLHAHSLHSYTDYLKVLASQPAEIESLMSKMTVHVTEFFRDLEVYRAFADKFLSELSEKKPLRAWSAGCSTGEEPYSISILLKTHLQGAGPGDYEILATDIDKATIAIAEKAEYPKESLKNVEESDRAHWFQPAGDKVRIHPDIKKAIRFRVHDLLDHWSAAIGGFHFIFCRNLLIYLTSDQQQDLYERFAHTLEPGGLLVLGLTETLLGPSRRYFHCVDIRHRIYRKAA